MGRRKYFSFYEGGRNYFQKIPFYRSNFTWSFAFYLKKSYLRAPNPPFLTIMKSSGPFLRNNAHEKLLASDWLKTSAFSCYQSAKLQHEFK